MSRRVVKKFKKILTKGDKHANVANINNIIFTIMQKFAKFMACKALGSNPFPVKVVETFLKESRFRLKDQFVEDIQKTNNLNIYTTVQRVGLMGVSRQRYAAFHQLRLIMLKELMQQTENERLFFYMNMLLTLYTGTTLEGKKFRDMIFRQELKLVEFFSSEDAPSDEMRRFVFVSCLFSDVQFLYEKEVLNAYLSICKKLESSL